MCVVCCGQNDTSFAGNCTKMHRACRVRLATNGTFLSSPRKDDKRDKNQHFRSAFGTLFFRRNKNRVKIYRIHVIDHLWYNKNIMSSCGRVSTRRQHRSLSLFAFLSRSHSFFVWLARCKCISVTLTLTHVHVHFCTHHAIVVGCLRE